MDAREIRVIGIGNEFRGDDAAGLQVVRRLKDMGFQEVECLEQGGEATALIEALEHTGRLILVDAVQSESAPGTIHRFQAGDAAIPSQQLRCSTHNFGVHEAIEMARALGKLPPSLMVYGIEGSRFGQGETMSPDVSAAVDRVAQEICQQLQTPGKESHA